MTKPTGKPASSAWQWGRTEQTRRALLDAARAVFTEQGFADTSIAEVVERAGSSVGSLYHHFGGKSELFLTLWQEHQQAHEEAASQAVAAARLAGAAGGSRGSSLQASAAGGSGDSSPQASTASPADLFCAGARAYLDGSWQRRDLALLFLTGDGPPGFEVIKRSRGHEWIAQNDALLRLPDTSLDRLYAAILTAVIGEGAREVAAAKTRRQAERIIDAVICYARRLMTEGPVSEPEADLGSLVSQAVAGHQVAGDGGAGSEAPVTGP